MLQIQKIIKIGALALFAILCTKQAAVSQSCVATSVTTTIQAEAYCEMSGIQTENTVDTGGGQNVGYIDANDYLIYNVTVPSTGTYTMKYRVASPNSTGVLQLEQAGGGAIYGTVNIPNTGGWQTWATISHNVTLTAGSQSLAVKANTSGWNINWWGSAEVVPVSNPGFRVVGYMPTWTGSATDIQYSKLTHINYSFLLPNSNGTFKPLENTSKLQQIVTLAHQNGVKVLIAIGGWDLGDGGGNDGAFETMASSSSTRNAFVINAMNIVNQYGLDGIDMDWEYPDTGSSANNYLSLMTQLSQTLHGQGKLLSAAVVAYNGDGVLSQVFDQVDFLNIMAYDGPEPNHSTYDYAVQALNYWKGRGLPASKAVLGVPFYARPSWQSYAAITAAGADPYSDSFNGNGYNGINTIKSKTALAMQQGSGIMIWELSQDRADQFSLVTAIDQEVNSGQPNDPPALSYQLVWSDEFTNGIGPDWVFETGTGTNGWGNNELQYYQSSNAAVANGVLSITARQQSVGGMQYTSARMKTQGRKSWKYGRIEARMQLPAFQGSWPAFWMLGDNIGSVGWPACGEIDIMEQVNTEQQTHGTIHWENNGYTFYTESTPVSVSSYHIYSIEWTESAIKWFVDGVQYHEANIQGSVNSTSEFHNNFFIILNMAVGGNWPGFTVNNGALPAVMNVDYVRVYQLSESTCSTVSVPGTIQAENYCFMSGIQLENTQDTGGGQHVGWINTNDYMTYMVNVPATASYQVSYRVARGTTGNGGIRLERAGGSQVYGTIAVPPTGGWQNWTTVSHTVQLSAGEQEIAIVATTDDFNLNWFSVQQVNNPPTANAGNDQTLAAGITSTTLSGSGSDPDGNPLTYSWTKITGPTATIVSPTSATTSITGLAGGNSYVFRLSVSDGQATTTDDVTITVNSGPIQNPYPTGVPHPIPGTIEFENFDTGGPGIAYNDATTTNSGGQGRTTEGVDTENCSVGGLNIGWTGAGEWTEYTVNVAQTGTYNFEFRVASVNSGGTFHLEFAGVNKTGTVTSVNTGGWQTWASINVINISLSAGVQVIRLALDAPNHNLDKVIITTTANVPVTGVSVSPTSTSSAVGATQQLTRTIAPANATNQNVTWTSSNTAVAMVNTSGLVTAGSTAGTATITVTTQDGGFTATSTVTVTGGQVAGYRIRNRWQNTYLTDGGANVTYSTTASGNNFVWILEDVGGGHVEIKNAGTGQYMHIENLTGSIQCTVRTSGWYSSRWAFETVDATYRRVRNAWQGADYIHVENLSGSAQHGTINTAWHSAQWAFEAVGGAREIEAPTENEMSDYLVSIYPNPVTGSSFTVELDQVSENGYQVEIIDFTGKRVFTNHFQTGKIEIPTDQFVSGVYLIRVLNGSHVSTGKIWVK